jgi:hypothetical protein
MVARCAGQTLREVSSSPFSPYGAATTMSTLESRLPRFFFLPTSTSASAHDVERHSLNSPNHRTHVPRFFHKPASGNFPNQEPRSFSLSTVAAGCLVCCGLRPRGVRLLRPSGRGADGDRRGAIYAARIARRAALCRDRSLPTRELEHWVSRWSFPRCSWTSARWQPRSVMVRWSPLVNDDKRLGLSIVNTARPLRQTCRQRLLSMARATLHRSSRRHCEALTSARYDRT